MENLDNILCMMIWPGTSGTIALTCKDYYVNDESLPPSDYSQDVTTGTTTYTINTSQGTLDYSVWFTRKLDTGDINKDKMLVVGDQTEISWAYGPITYKTMRDHEKYTSGANHYVVIPEPNIPVTPVEPTPDR